MNWWLIVLVVLVLLVLLKFKEFRHRFGLIAIIVLVLFMVASFGQLYASHNLDLTSFDGIVNAGKVYFGWLGNAGSNVLKLSTYAVKQDWGVTINEVNKTVGK